MTIPFDNTYARLPERFFARQQPGHVPRPMLIRINAGLAAELRIDAAWLASDAGVAALAGNGVPSGADPIAQAYAGHQFGMFVPQLGDGRAILLGEVIDVHGHRRDIQLKGSGRTRFSRGGDGKAALGPVLREFIVSEAMAALGVKTTRALAAVTTGERILRADGMMPGAIFTRVAASHIRVGTFEYLAARSDVDAVRQLADYVIARHYPDVATAPEPYAALLEAVVVGQADLVAHWMALGFVHGVMNTDNTAISGETIDYGPCAFVDAFNPGAVFSSIDVQGRYAWNRQPDIALWNVTRFAETLLPLLAADQPQAIAIAERVLERFGVRFRDAYVGRFRAKLGLADSASPELIEECLALLGRNAADFTLFFRRLTRVAAGDDPHPLVAMFETDAAFSTWFQQWRRVVDSTAGLQAMRAANPAIIPRNHRVEEAIAHASRGDFNAFHRLVDALARPYEDRVEYADLELAPQEHEIVRQTFCGT